MYTQEEENIICSHFNLHEGRKPVKTADCVEFLKEHQVGELFANRSVQSIQDKVKTILRQLKKTESLDH